MPSERCLATKHEQVCACIYLESRAHQEFEQLDDKFVNLSIDGNFL